MIMRHAISISTIGIDLWLLFRFNYVKMSNGHIIVFISNNLRERRIKFFQHISCTIVESSQRGDKNGGHNLMYIHRQFGALSCERAFAPENRNCALSASSQQTTAIDVTKTNYIQHLSVFCYLNSHSA